MLKIYISKGRAVRVIYIYIYINMPTYDNQRVQIKAHMFNSQNSLAVNVCTCFD